MNVKLVSITAPTVGDGDWKAEDLIAYCARVSNPNNQMNKETAPRLVKYLIKHRHWSPFELASMCVEIKTSRAIAAQILRHRSFSFQEFSQRYSSIQELEPLELRGQAETNRQSSTDVIDPVLTNNYKNVPASLAVSQHLNEGVKLYEELIEAGVARETARMVLPLTTETTMYMNGTVRSWIHYIDLRSKEDTQKEHREIAEAIKEVFVENFPNVSEALEW
jgi:thymidylate synthase (FAD)|tara:strand:+ start:2916 stop:3578 length:663 start_codon:yes stop_codon:yes gene_type:complete